VLIVCGADENYAMPLAVTLHSALVNLNEKGPVTLYIVDGGIRDESRHRIERVVDATPPSVDLRWTAIDTETVSDLPTRGWINTTAYLRLFIPKIVPDEAKRALYLDSDLQVEASLARLWAQDLNNHALAAVQAYGTPYVSSRRGIEKYENLGYAPKTPYFNSGILLINLDRWRRDAIAERVLQYVREYRQHLHALDQEGLNAVLADDWKPLNLKWNVMSHLVNFEDWPDTPFKDRVRPQKDELINDPYIYHFAGGSKPWQIACNHPAQLQWIDYLRESGWFSPSERIRWLGDWFLRYSWFETKKRLGIT
jgi:lipopolysaccharide biosynthesis glycosyltransferase